jgi:hypothetical protein
MHGERGGYSAANRLRPRESEGREVTEHVFIIADDQSDWKEVYLLENDVDPIEWVKKALDSFNATLKPNELPRRYKSHTSETKKDDKENHDWIKRLTGMSVQFRNQIVDVFYCSKCGITGKRYNLGGVIKRDSKFRAKKYAQCIGNKEAAK